MWGWFFAFRIRQKSIRMCDEEEVADGFVMQLNANKTSITHHSNPYAILSMSQVEG